MCSKFIISAPILVFALKKRHVFLLSHVRTQVPHITAEFRSWTMVSHCSSGPIVQEKQCRITEASQLQNFAGFFGKSKRSRKKRPHAHSHGGKHNLRHERTLTVQTPNYCPEYLHQKCCAAVEKP